ncbi:MAG: haloacid dehalogenase-like hydrolase [Alphaproteobacteria bacterium]|nr:haloacid dehalogenase-like hydrolase [Alphaproteobacteria bacterium]
MLQKVDVVVFDFDGTLSARDCNVEFAKYCMRHSVRPWVYLPLIGIAAIVRTVRPAGIWWRQCMRRFMTPDMVRRFAPDFIREHRRERFGWARERVNAERAAGRRVVCISAGPDYLVPELVRDMKFDAVICSKMDAKKPWKYKKLCWGANKVVSLDEWAMRNKFIPRVVRSYSDSLSDMPMMEIAAERVWIDRKTGLRITR